ncbi:MAG TPA: PorV/PorQ family protein [Spirochaetota bacterium]|nr:PorV/PorQ family protein [Spirochaetota bacterium]HPF04398.1 PorV/PorQ family protein [Spirochaetota bacterium]HPJ40831.1 PorV/PorQ family protein [Spirochaetota bacterium]HPR39279.1 PorV/PorQ family protein [Spirochaetota bacterium]HRX46014.1 PorV/PorQ family protein [Spirochaetota bacterium]
MKIIRVIYLLLLLSIPSMLFAEGSIGTSGADFLELGVGSRPLGMGEAFTAEINDINSLYYNPAGLATLKYPVLSIFHHELILDSRFENISMAQKVYGGWLALSNSFFWVPPFEKIDIDGNETGEVQFYNGNFSVGYGYDLELFYLGGSVKYIYQKIDTLFLSSVAVDVGILKDMYLYSPFDSPLRNFSVGLSIVNLGTNAKDDPLPRMIRFGTSYKMTKWFGFNVDFTEYMINMSDLYDFTYGFEESFRINTGIELNYLEILYLRGGWRFNDAGTYTMGMGFNYAIKDVAFGLDASYSDNGIFGPVYSITATFKLIPKVITVEDKVKAEAHYRKGIKHFVADDIDSAINEFNTARDYNPYHKNIDRKIEDLKEIKKLREENRELDEELKKEQYQGDFFN